MLETSTTKESLARASRETADCTYCFACATQKSEYEEKYASWLKMSSPVRYAGSWTSRHDEQIRTCRG